LNDGRNNDDASDPEPQWTLETRESFRGRLFDEACE
jgi:hypothetical protein